MDASCGLLNEMVIMARKKKKMMRKTVRFWVRGEPTDTTQLPLPRGESAADTEAAVDEAITVEARSPHPKKRPEEECPLAGAEAVVLLKEVDSLPPLQVDECGDRG